MPELMKWIIPGVIVLVVLLLLAAGYLKAPPDTAYIISGLSRKRIHLSYTHLTLPTILLV